MMARRARLVTKKKKKNPTAMILMIAGVGFAFILILVVLLNSQSTPKQSKSTAKKENRTTTTAVESNKRAPNTAAVKTKKKKFSKQTTQRADHKKRAVPRQRQEGPGNSIDISKNQKQFSPSDLNTLPIVFTLPDKPVGEHILSDQVQFTDNAQLDIKLHSAALRGAEIKRTNDNKHSWTLTTNDNKPIADIDLSEQGIIFKWDANTKPEIRTSLHNSKITLRSGRFKKTIQLRPITKAPHIQLFGRDAEQQYSFNLKHAPSEIHWSLEPTHPNQDPFSFPSVGVPTTDGPIPIKKSLEWTPENNTGVVKAKYVWKCATEPGRKLHGRRIQITQTKKYKIGDAKWRPLTTESLRKDWDQRLERYDNVVAGIQRKIAKRKYPSGKQISTLRRMVREGIAFADVRVFYYALPDRTMRVDFRTPCGTSDTLLAQYPIAATPPNDFGDIQTVRPFIGEPVDDESIASPDDNNSSQGDDLWTMPPGENPWRARAQQLENISSEKK